MGGIISSILGITKQSVDLAKSIINDKNMKVQEEQQSNLRNFMSNTVPFNFNKRSDRKQQIEDGRPYSDSWMVDMLSKDIIPDGYTYADLIADGYGKELDERNKRVAQRTVDNAGLLADNLQKIKDQSDLSGYPNIVKLIDSVIKQSKKTNAQNIDMFIEKLKFLQNMVNNEINKDKFNDMLAENRTNREMMIENAATRLLSAEDNAVQKYLTKKINKA